MRFEDMQPVTKSFADEFSRSFGVGTDDYEMLSRATSTVIPASYGSGRSNAESDPSDIEIMEPLNSHTDDHDDDGEENLT